MESTIQRALRSAASTLLFLTLCACSYVNEVEIESPLQPSVPSVKEGCIVLRIPALSSQTKAKVASIELFQFSDGVFVNKQTVDPSKDNIVEFDRKPHARIYALAGYSVEGLQTMDELDFSAMTIPVPKDAYSAPVFFSSVTNLPEGSSDCKIELHRGVARLDIDNGDPDLKIEKVSIAGASSSSQIFQTDCKTCACASANYNRAYEAGLEGHEESAFILFETSSPITVTVCGRRNGKAVEIVTETPAIIRNTVYTVSIDKEDSDSANERTFSDNGIHDGEDDMPTASIRVRNWVEGDLENGSIDLGESAISLESSCIPAGVRINPADNTVTVPADGVAGMKIAFATRSPLRLGSVLSDTEGVSIIPVTPSPTDDGFISEFMVDVAKQPKCAPRYQATVFFNGSSSFFINIEVEPSPYQVPTVHIGGHDWMCFNAVSQDPEEQTYLPSGMTVEKMYIERFVDCLGNQFQYGRPNPFSPWKAYDPGCFADRKRDVPWSSKSMMPLPKGFHVASAAEWQDLIPSGTIIPASYRTPSGDSIRATIVTFRGTLDDTPSAATNNQNYLKRCVLFESVTTGARLYLPIAGIKTNASVEIPSHPKFRFDTRSGYWMKEEQSILSLAFETLSDGSEGVLLDRGSWNADGFVMVRGIKD